MSHHVITLDEIAGELGIARRSAAHAVRRLQRAHGFPPGLPGLPTRFSRHLVASWFRTNGGLASASPSPANDEQEVDGIAAHRAHLAARYGVSA